MSVRMDAVYIIYIYPDPKRKPFIGYHAWFSSAYKSNFKFALSHVLFHSPIYSYVQHYSITTNSISRPEIMNAYTLLCHFALTLILAASTLSLPAARRHVARLNDSYVPGTPLGSEPEGVTVEPSGPPGSGFPGSGDIHDGPDADQKRAILLRNLDNANTHFMVILAMQLLYEAQLYPSPSFAREKCSDIVADLSPDENDTLCPWTYTCTYDQHLYPNFVVQANLCHNVKGESCPSCGSINTDIGSI